mgnify:FL=1
MQHFVKGRTCPLTGAYNCEGVGTTPNILLIEPQFDRRLKGGVKICLGFVSVRQGCRGCRKQVSFDTTCQQAKQIYILLHNISTFQN